MMWGVTLMFFSCLAAQVTSNEVKMDCQEFDEDLPPTSNKTPSFLADLKMELVTVGGKHMLNISWAVNIDVSNKHLTGTRILINGEYIHCEYNPTFANANLTEQEQKWFHYLVEASYGHNSVQAANLPLPQLGSGQPYKYTSLKVERVKPKTSPTPRAQTHRAPRAEITTSASPKEPDTGNVNFTNIAVAILGGLASFMILSSCYIIYKSCGTNFAASLGFKKLPTSSTVPVPVLVVYPAENLVFQQAVVALSEFLQWYGGCSVAVDMWQQGKIAELGPMRWLAEQAKAADQVLIVCPQRETSSSPPSRPPPNPSFPGPTIPAAAHDLYPLILNMVASHAKSASDLAKFWVVQLGEKRDNRLSNLPLELRACKSFCLVRDLSKLCKSLHTNRQDRKRISDLIFRPGVASSERGTGKLREAVEKLGGGQPSIFREVEPLKSVVTTI